MTTEKLTWYVARSGGIVAWCLLALALIWGLLLSSRLLGRRSSPAWLLAVHRHLGGLSLFFTVVHVAAVMLDDFVDFGLREVLVPMASEWRPGAVAWGIVGLYLLVAIEVTSLAMRFLPKKLWRGIHWTSAVLFVVATVHGWQAGSDTGRAFLIATVACIVVLAALTAIRAVQARRQPVTSDRQTMLAELRQGRTGPPKDPATGGAADETALPVIDLSTIGGDWSFPEPVRASATLTPTSASHTRSLTRAAGAVPEPGSGAAVAVVERPPAGEPDRRLDPGDERSDDAREVGPTVGVWKVRQSDD